MLRPKTAFLSLFCYTHLALAALPIDLTHQSPAILKTLTAEPTQLEETSRQLDFKQTMHVRARETYQHYPVWGSEIIMHIPSHNAAQSLVKLDGVLYQNISMDLTNTPVALFSAAHAQSALQHSPINGVHQQNQLMVYIDHNNKAHWAYYQRFYVAPTPSKPLPAKPNLIIDALTFKVYEQWDEVKTTFSIEGGGYGGNQKSGKVTYDGLTNHFAKLPLTRDAKLKLCLLKNTDVEVYDINAQQLEAFPCELPDLLHNNVYWSGNRDNVNGGYSPANDALFAGMMIKKMYQEWYHLPVLVNQDGTPMVLVMAVHAAIANAYWDGQAMTFGDGLDLFYPLTSLDVAAHEISHGYTEQHSNLLYYGQSGGMNEAFSDMAAQAAEYYVTGHNDWQIGVAITKQKGEVLRYMDVPSKDCAGAKECSIDNFNEYHTGMNVHYSSGVYNRFFYLLATSPGWNIKKAFDVMVQANTHYWTAHSSFLTGACGVVRAARDFDYATTAVRQAFSSVGIDTINC
jgi:pseudolysin